MAIVSDDGPKIAVVELGRDRKSGSGPWLFGWSVQNLTGQAIQFFAARCPHGQFKSEERSFVPPLKAEAGKKITIEMLVRCDEPARTVIENGFLILLVEWLNNRWRIFVRLRVTVTLQGVPTTAVQLITTQRVGFSGIS